MYINTQGDLEILTIIKLVLSNTLRGKVSCFRLNGMTRVGGGESYLC
jgi:hypothetical protein